jgi:hypothetical protein
LRHLLTSHNFDAIQQVAKKIGSEELEKNVTREWISKSDSFNENEDQIKALVRHVSVAETVEEEKSGGDNWTLSCHVFTFRPFCLMLRHQGNRANITSLFFKT